MKKRAFTLIELLVVIAIIALLLAIIMPALSKAKELTYRLICKNNIRQQGLGVILYSEQSDGRVPDSYGANWFWDLSFWTSNRISEMSGIDYEVFFCPSNKRKKSSDARFWQYSWVGASTQPLPHKDESILTDVQQQGQYRVLSYVYFFDSLDSNGQSRNPQTTVTGQKITWITKIPELRNASSTMMIMDAMISASGTDWNFDEILGGGAPTKYGIPDCTNHFSRQRLTGSAGSGQKPSGGDIVFADGHAEWRSFDRMQYRMPWGQWWWW